MAERDMGREGTGKGGGGGGFGADEVNEVVFGPRAALEVSIEGAQGEFVFTGGLPLADTRAAGTFEDTGAGGDKVGQGAILGEEVENLA